MSASENDHLSNIERDAAISSFFRRNGFDTSMREVCDDFAASRFEKNTLRSAVHQGYCSYTLTVGERHILQFRPEAFRLDMRICDLSNAMFPELVPLTTYMGRIGDGSGNLMDVYLIEKARGISLTAFRQTLGTKSEERLRIMRRVLVEDLASVFAISYLHSQDPRALQARGHQGKIGSSLRDRLHLMRNLPSLQGVQVVDDLGGHIDHLELLTPWCLTHGDLVPDNIMVDATTGHLTGLIDWAEGEWLPFGTGLYGLEETLGEDNGGPEGFQLYPEHDELRALFWKQFLSQVCPSTGTQHIQRLLTDAAMGRRLGILLWRGIAFDDGKLDRVVDAERDKGELQKLNLFLGAPSPYHALGWRTKIRAFLSSFGGFLWGCLPCLRSGRTSQGNGDSRQSVSGSSSRDGSKAGESWREFRN